MAYYCPISIEDRLVNRQDSTTKAETDTIAMFSSSVVKAMDALGISVDTTVDRLAGIPIGTTTQVRFNNLAACKRWGRILASALDIEYDGPDMAESEDPQ